jgi:hypothetical protein
MQIVASIVVLAVIESDLGLAVLGAVAISVLMSLAFLLTRDGAGGSAYDRIGAGGISRDSDYDYAGPPPASDSPAARAEREREIRQMLSARSERLVRGGQPALDVEAELVRLLADQQARRTHDPEILAEVRQLVLARNERRIRGGEQPLDVEAEVARTLAELDG